MVNCPGSAEALRLGGLTACIDTEQWAAARVDYLLTREDVEDTRIGLAGWSLGGYYAPRAAAYWEHVLWVWGTTTSTSSSTSPTRSTSTGGREDHRPVPGSAMARTAGRFLEYAHRSYEQAVNSPGRTLRIFTPEEGDAEHIGLDHLPHVRSYIADGVTDTFVALPLSHLQCTGTVPRPRMTEAETKATVDRFTDIARVL